jgi:uncharacterized membrane protein
MKPYILPIVVSSVLISLLLFVNISLADGSLTITSSVLDSKVRPGGETTVFLTLTNPSTTTAASSIRLYILPGPYTSSSNSYIEMGSLDVKASQQTSIIVKVGSSATSMTSYIVVKADYYAGTTQQETTINVPITIDRVPLLQATDVQYVPSIIEPGNEVALHFNLENDGDGIAKDIKVTLSQSPQEFVVDGSPETFIDNIDPKDSTSILFNIIVDPSVAIGTYSIPISVSYSDETRSENYTSIKNIGLVVTGKYNFIITPSQSVVASGKTGDVDIQTSNAGTQEAQYLNLQILPSNPIIEVSPSAVYIGNLKSDDYDMEKFTFKIADDTSPGVYPLKLQLNYRDPYGKTYTQDFETNITVSSLKEYSSSNAPKLSPLTIIILLLIIGAIAYFIYRKVRKKKK